ncbi:MAG: hypothetical protein J2P48_17045 [Alphaproteobacteria bacterium]|nr:hypothetical protein [Alphaproteobacteria bacterium]
MGLIETVAAFGLCALVLGAAIVLDRRPYTPGKLNYVPLMIICAAALLLFARHLLTLIM